jgi:nickel/cobalt exporter
MNDNVLTTIAFTGFTVAFFHAAIPTHWLPFVAAGHAQKWTARKTLAVTAFAGGGHVLATAALGFTLTLLGVAINARIGTLFPWIAGGVLAALGLFYWWRQISGRGHGHTHLFSAHRHEHAEERDATPAAGASRHGNEHEYDATERTSDRVAITSLFALLTFSPCEGFLPIYVSGIRFGWPGFAVLTMILSFATVAAMLLFTSLALAGVRRIRVRWWEQWQSGIMGSLLILIGILVVLFEH